MSIERELLKRVKAGDDDGDFFISHRLYKDIETFLDQPEQEPEAWIIVNKETGYRTQVSDLTPFLYHREIFEVIPLYTAPPVKSEQEPVGVVRTIGGYPDDSEHVVDWLCKYKDLKEGDRLYLAQKREPLSDGAVCQILLKKEWKGFVDLVRTIEKMHGIGGGE